VSPTVTKKTMPPTISTEYRKNIVRTMRVEFLSKDACPARATLGAHDDGHAARRHGREFDLGRNVRP